ncbi:hypothetical protein RKD22_004402 [Streptomyces pristinaespiralis]
MTHPGTLVLIMAVAVPAPLLAYRVGRWIRVPLVIFQVALGIGIGPGPGRGAGRRRHALRPRPAAGGHAAAVGARPGGRAGSRPTRGTAGDTEAWCTGVVEPVGPRRPRAARPPAARRRARPCRADPLPTLPVPGTARCPCGLRQGRASTPGAERQAQGRASGVRRQAQGSGVGVRRREPGVGSGAGAGLVHAGRPGSCPCPFLAPHAVRAACVRRREPGSSVQGRPGSCPCLFPAPHAVRAACGRRQASGVRRG